MIFLALLIAATQGDVSSKIPCDAANIGDWHLAIDGSEVIGKDGKGRAFDMSFLNDKWYGLSSSIFDERSNMLFHATGKWSCSENIVRIEYIEDGILTKAGELSNNPILQFQGEYKFERKSSTQLQYTRVADNKVLLLTQEEKYVPPDVTSFSKRELWAHELVKCALAISISETLSNVSPRTDIKPYFKAAQDATSESFIRNERGLMDEISTEYLAVMLAPPARRQEERDGWLKRHRNMCQSLSASPAP